MPSLENIQTAVADIISTYEKRIDGIGTTFDTTFQLIESFQESFQNNRQKEVFTNQIRDILAKNEHLRKKDFDIMMREVLISQEKRERIVKDLLKTYIEEQKNMAANLKENLHNVRDSLAKGELQRIKDFQESVKGIMARQDERRMEVSSLLREFQNEQRDLAGRLRELLAKGRDLRINDLKQMVLEFNHDHCKRIIRREERGDEIKSLLLNFNKKRTEWTKSRWKKSKRPDWEANKTLEKERGENNEYS